jgi:cyclohexa-1,5-dienecarbonyl-CoA hydratase
MSDAAVQVSFAPDGTRASIRLFHPKGNIITAAMLAQIGGALDEIAGRPHLKLLTIEGAGADFSFGASIPEHAPDEIARVLPQAHALIERLLDAPVPTAALVRGRCLGGGFEIALVCDFIFAESSATFGLPEIALGVFPPAACALLPARVGAARATTAILTGASHTAGAWHAAGLVAFVSPDGALDHEVNRWFETHLAPQSAEALRQAAAAVRFGLRAQVRTLLPELERLYLDVLMKTEDAREGVAAFLGKRLPNWTDR